MSKRIFEFLCENRHVSEALVSPDTRETYCKECGKSAVRIISAPTVSLEGITGAFPGAYDAWERKRKEKLAVERKQNLSHGTE